MSVLFLVISKEEGFSMEGSVVISASGASILTNEKMTVLNSQPVDPKKLFDDQVEMLSRAGVSISEKDLKFFRERLVPGLFLLVPLRPDVVSGQAVKKYMSHVIREGFGGSSTLSEHSGHRSYTSIFPPSVPTKSYMLINVLDGRTLKGNTVTHDREKLHEQERHPFDLWEGLIGAISIFHASPHNLCFAGTTLHDNCVPVLSTDITSRQAILHSREISSVEEKRGTPSYGWRLYAK